MTTFEFVARTLTAKRGRSRGRGATVKITSKSEPFGYPADDAIVLISGFADSDARQLEAGINAAMGDAEALADLNEMMRIEREETG